MDINKLGQELSSLINDISISYNNKNELKMELESKISHISWKKILTPDAQEKFINGLISAADSKSLIESLDVIKTCLFKEYKYLGDTSFDITNLTNEIETLEDMFHQAILKKLKSELIDGKKSADFDLELSKKTHEDNPKLREIEINKSIANRNRLLGFYSSTISNFETGVIMPAKTDREYNNLQIKMKRKLISSSEFSYKMSELRDLRDYYTYNSTISELRTKAIQESLTLEAMKLNFPNEGHSELLNESLNNSKIDYSLEIIQLEEDMFNLKQRIDNKNINKNMADGLISEEQWRKEKQLINARISPLQLEEMKRRMSKANQFKQSNDNTKEQSNNFSR